MLLQISQIQLRLDAIIEKCDIHRVECLIDNQESYFQPTIPLRLASIQSTITQHHASGIKTMPSWVSHASVIGMGFTRGVAHIWEEWWIAILHCIVTIESTNKFFTTDPSSCLMHDHNSEQPSHYLHCLSTQIFWDCNLADWTPEKYS